MPKADELPAFLIPKMKPGRVQAAPERDGLHILENRMRSVTSLQIIIGDAGAEVMDVVKPNIAREPLESLGQTVERTALERGNCVIPCVTALPVRPFELMLNVEHPDTNCPGHDRDWQLDEQIHLPAEHPAQRESHAQNSEVSPPNRPPLPRLCLPRRKSLPEDEKKNWRDDQEHKRIPR